MKTLILLLLTVLGAAAEDATPVPAPKDFTYRITGLFSHEREPVLRDAVKQISGVELVSLDFDHAEGVFRYDPAITFKGVAPEKIFERLDQKVRDNTRSTLGIQPASTTPKERLVKVEIPVGILDCKACALGAYEVIFRTEGVTQATVEQKTGLVTALIDPDKTSREALEEIYKKRELLKKVVADAPKAP